jgi:hypothetical protein
MTHAKSMAFGAVVPGESTGQFVEHAPARERSSRSPYREALLDEVTQGY